MVGRHEASPIYDRICEQLRIEDFAFQYESAKESPRSQGFRIHLERREGRGVFGITIDNPSNQNPIRLLLGHTWPPSLEHVHQQFDIVSAAVFDALSGSWQKVKAEVRLRAHCAVRGGDALRFLGSEFLKVPSQWVDSLGQPITFTACRFQTASTEPIQEPLDSPMRDLSIEVLREDPSLLYFELISKWLQVPRAVVHQGAVSVGTLRQFTDVPSAYVESEHQFLEERLRALSDLGRSE
jgi:hypothetical protein